MEATEPVRDQLLFINSANRNSGTPQDCWVQLPPSTIEAVADEMLQFELVDFSVFRTWNNVTAGVNQNFQIQWQSESVPNVWPGYPYTQSYTVPAGQYTAQSLLYQLQSLLVYNPLQIVAGKNDGFTVTDNATGSNRTVNVTLPAGYPTPAQICAAVQSQLNAALNGNPYTCTFTAPGAAPLNFRSGSYTLTTSASSWYFSADFSVANSAYQTFGLFKTAFPGPYGPYSGTPLKSILPPLVNGNQLGVTYSNDQNMFTFTPPANVDSAVMDFSQSNQPYTATLFGFPLGSAVGPFSTAQTSSVPVNVNGQNNIIMSTSLQPHSSSLSVDNIGPYGSRMSQTATLARIPIDVALNQLLFWVAPRHTYQITLNETSVTTLHVKLTDEYGNSLPMDNTNWTATFRVLAVRPKTADSDRVVSTLETILRLMQIGIGVVGRQH